MWTIISALFLVFFALPCWAQDSTRLQGKIVFHAPVPQTPGWFPTAWSVTNIRDESPDNTNFMLGVGRKLENGWVEFMLQRQYSLRSNQWFFDFRLQRRLTNRVSIFIEMAPFLEIKGLYHFERIEYQLGKINLLMESENIHRDGLNSVGIGPGIGVPAMKLVGRIKFAPVVAWQIRPNDPDFVRFYFAFLF